MLENRTQSAGVPLNDVIFNFGSFAVVARAVFSSSSFFASFLVRPRVSPATFAAHALLVFHEVRLFVVLLHAIDLASIPVVVVHVPC